MGLKVNPLKTEVLVQCTEPPQPPFQFYIHGEAIKPVEHFTYVGSILTPDCYVNMEIQRRKNLASTTFSRLRDRIFSNNNLRIDVVISTLLYGSETWTLYNRQNHILKNFNIRYLHNILGVSGKDKITHDELYHHTQTTSIEITMAQ
ncbi:uncharacterized protein LOC143033193 [Oratosquilla oratoria]|uniref:uncharacterized protein LOC143033193 n=1 Tax=Oratosquilla oratoria TaxID=337810 RepID=UPI003F7750D9